jgi:2-dehydropantoate 2-reductase
MRIAIFGAGAVGSYIGGKLIRSGEHDIFMVARGKHLKALNSSGLKVSSINGDFEIKSLYATDTPSQIGQVDYVILTVKSWMVAKATRSMLPLIGKNTVVIPLQNGVESPGQISSIIDPKHVLGGMCRIFSSIPEPGHISHFGSEPLVVIGELNGEKTDRVSDMGIAFNNSHLACSISPDITASMWEKLIFVGPVGAVGSVTRAPLGEILQLKQSRELLQNLMEEIYEVGLALGVKLNQNVVHDSIKYAEQSPFEATSSMQRDIIDGHRSELESQVGVVVRLGTKAKIATPVHEYIYSLLLPIETKARNKIEL